jgi:hypothetical protein
MEWIDRVTMFLEANVRVAVRTNMPWDQRRAPLTLADRIVSLCFSSSIA